MSLADRPGTTGGDPIRTAPRTARTELTVSTEQILELVTAAIGVDASEVSILLVERDGTMRDRASSNPAIRAIAQFELQCQEGPCIEACTTGIAVHASLTPDADTRWPRFAPYARDVGVRSVSALPMRLQTDIIGALALFSARPEPRSPEERQVTQALADIAAIGILQERALQAGHEVLTQLQTALESRIVIEQAKGIIAQGAQISVDDAFTLLRAYARNHNSRLRQVAYDVIDGTLPTAIFTRPRRASHAAGPAATAGRHMARD
jgi:GAF domain-containing protein